MLVEIGKYIDENILQSAVWDNADDRVRQKAINNATRILKSNLSKYYPDTIPVEHLAEQVIWMLKIDDSLQRAEMGITYIQVDGISMNISDVDRTICPFIYKDLKLPKGILNRRRVVSYSLNTGDTFRGGCRC